MIDISLNRYLSEHAKSINLLISLNLTDQQKIRIGACAWSFEDWRGAFYPPDVPDSQWLEFYARYFPAVEVDSTFYGPPAENTVRRWIEMTPAGFRFACKLPREITHTRRLRECSAELNSFLRALEPLAPKLQVILIQLPPSLAPKDGKPALRKFLEQLPQGFLPRTTDFLYLRLLGDYATKYDVAGGHLHRYEKLLWKREAALESWSLKVERHLSEVRSVWTFVSNHFEGFAPETAQRLAQRLGYELLLPSQVEKILAEQERSQLDLL